MSVMGPMMMLIMNVVSVVIVWVGAYGIDAGTTHEYDLRLWIDENQTVENATNKIFKTRISIITSYGK